MYLRKKAYEILNHFQKLLNIVNILVLEFPPKSCAYFTLSIDNGNTMSLQLLEHDISRSAIPKAKNLSIF